MELGQSVRYIPEETALGRWGGCGGPPRSPSGQRGQELDQLERVSRIRQGATVGS